MPSNWSLDNIYNQITLLNTCKALTYGLGLHMVQIGIWSFWKPVTFTSAFGMRYDGKRFDSKTVLNDKEENYWPVLYAPREAGLGLLLLTFASLSDWRAAGIAVGIVAGLVATVDGVAIGFFSKGGWSEAIKGHGVLAVILRFVSTGLLTL